MEEAINTWIANGCVGLTTIISVLLIILRALKTFKSDNTDLTKIVEDALVKMDEKKETDRQEQRNVIDRQNAVINAQQKQIEELTRNQNKLLKKIDTILEEKRK